jgi:hypothetical protein
MSVPPKRAPYRVGRTSGALFFPLNLDEKLERMLDAGEVCTTTCSYVCAAEVPGAKIAAACVCVGAFTPTT